MLKIVSFRICPFVQRVTAVVELKQVDYEVEYISLAAKPDWFLTASPHGKVPILIEDQGVLFESGPICEYVDETCGDFRLHPDDAFERARHRAWIELAARNYFVQCRAQRSLDAEQLAANQAELFDAFAKMEEVTSPGRYFGGGKLSMVDAAWFVLLHRAQIIYECSGFDFLAKFPRLKRWQDALLKVDALRNSAPAGFIDEFVDFYLHKGTHLGKLMEEGGGHCGTMGAAGCDPATLAACCG